MLPHSQLMQLTQLQSLRLAARYSLPDNIVAAMAAMPALTSLELQCGKAFEENHSDVGSLHAAACEPLPDCRPLARLPRLRRLLLDDESDCGEPLPAPAPLDFLQRLHAFEVTAYRPILVWLPRVPLPSASGCRRSFFSLLPMPCVSLETCSVPSPSPLALTPPNRPLRCRWLISSWGMC